ncbi:MAG: DUF3137 domain-containing protein [Candidatus Paceibacterota bacterium]
MKDREFEKVWQEQIWPFLRETEDKRKVEQKKAYWGLVLIFGFSIAIVPLDDGGADFWWLSIIGGVILLVATWKLLQFLKETGFKKLFKRKVFNTLNNLTDFTWKIHLDDEFTEEEKEAARHKMIFEEEHSLFTKKENTLAKYDLLGNLMRIDGKQAFKDSGLYTDYTSLGCEDKLTSRWQHSSVEAYEITANERRNKETVTIFRGFLVKASIDKEFSGETYVQTESDSGTVAGESRLPFGSSDVRETELEWIDFEKFLQVKSSDPTEARQIFTPDFMEVVHDWWREHEKPLRMAFKGKAVYIAYPTHIDLEPRIFGKLEAEKGAVKDTLELLMFIENIIKTIIGGQRLWFDKPLVPQPPKDYK